MGLPSLGEVAEGESVDVPEFVAELLVPNDSLHIQVDGALEHVREHSKSEGVSTTLRDTIREVFLLSGARLSDFLGSQVGFLQLLEEDIKPTAVHDFKRVNDVTLRLGHLSTVLITDHRVKEDGVEGELVSELKGHHDHASNPEEKDVTSSLK